MQNQDKISSINQDQVENTEAPSSANNSQQLIPTDLEGAVLQLKEKIKENKKIENKNKKLEAKFIEQFKQQKALKKDWTVLTSIIKIIFPQSEQKPIGKYDMDELKEMWAYRQSTFTSKIQEMMQQTAKQKQKMEKDLVELTQERIHKITHECKEKIDNINKELDSYKKNNKNLADQLADFDKKLDVKNDEVSKLTKQKLKLEHQINQFKMKTITDQLQDKKVAQEEKTNIETNQFLAMRQQVDNLMLKRDQLRELLKAAKTNIQKLKETIKEKNQQIEKLKQQKNSLSQKNQFRQTSLQNKQSISSCSDDGTKQQQILKDERGSHHLAGDDQYVHRQYMKNVFIRYMKSIIKGDETQTQILINILLTILKFNNKQREILQERKKGWFGLY